jgi:uncharacterized protein YecT (DUF1311 family)
VLATLLCVPASRADDMADCPYHVRSLAYSQCAITALENELAARRKQLDQAFRMALARIGAEARPGLKQSQAAWQAHVEKACAYPGSAQSGPSSSVTIYELRCQVREIKSRIDLLDGQPSRS